MDEVTKNYVEKGLVGRFNFDRELDFIQSHGQNTCDMYENKYISFKDRNDVIEGLQKRYKKLMCFKQEMFERWGG